MELEQLEKNIRTSIHDAFKGSLPNVLDFCGFKLVDTSSYEYFIAEYLSDEVEEKLYFSICIDFNDGFYHGWHVELVENNEDEHSLFSFDSNNLDEIRKRIKNYYQRQEV